MCCKCADESQTEGETSPKVHRQKTLIIVDLFYCQFILSYMPVLKVTEGFSNMKANCSYE